MRNARILTAMVSLFGACTRDQSWIDCKMRIRKSRAPESHATPEDTLCATPLYPATTSWHPALRLEYWTLSNNSYTYRIGSLLRITMLPAKLLRRIPTTRVSSNKCSSLQAERANCPLGEARLLRNVRNLCISHNKSWSMLFNRGLASACTERWRRLG